MKKEESMNLYCAVFLGLILTVPGLVRSMDRTVLTSPSYISQAGTPETRQVNLTPEFTQHSLSKKPYKSLRDIFKGEPWRLSRPIE